MSFEILADSIVEPVTLDEAKLFCRIDGEAEDNLLNRLITAARTQAQNITGQFLARATWVYRNPCLAEYAEVLLDQVPIYALNSVQVSGQEVEAANYRFEASSGRLRPTPAVFYAYAGFPAGPTVLTGQLGYEYLPEPLKQWIVVRVNTLYSQRETFATGANFNQFDRSFVDCLLDPYIIHGGF